MVVETKRRSVSEVRFANHEYEFFRFYDKHKSFCDEISGVKERVLMIENTESKFFITKNNFSFGIKKLSSFVIDSLHYIPDRIDAIKLKKRIFELENRFLEDSDYHNLCSVKKRNVDEEVELQQKYFKYLIECFRMGSELTQFLQYSLMVGTRDINKKLEYYNDNGIYKNLANYRDEISDGLANFKLENCLYHLRQILGYYFTYKILMGKNETDLVDSLIPDLCEYIIDSDILSVVRLIKGEKILTDIQEEFLKRETFAIKNLLSNIYFISNKALSERRVLPKIEKRVFVDRSLI